MKKCPWCRGSGLNKAVYGPVPCPDCRETGYVEDNYGEEVEQEKEDGMESIRHPERRIVHSKRARVLRKRGEDVWFDHNTKSGKAVYSWMPKESK